MKFCPKCLTEYTANAVQCAECRVPLVNSPTAPTGDFSLMKLLNNFDHLSTPIFIPYNGFYDNWNATNERLQLMLHDILKWLHISDVSVVASYHDIDTAGRCIVSNLTHIIHIATTFSSYPLIVGAILAHECMHVWLHINALERSDRDMNEYLTDTYTIASGFGILVMNGITFYRKSPIGYDKWYIAVRSLFKGNDDRTCLGYFKPEMYCDYFERYLDLRGINPRHVVGCIHPMARKMLSKNIRKCKPDFKPDVIIQLEKALRRNTLIISLVMVPVWLLVLENFFPSLIPSILQMFH